MPIYGIKGLLKHMIYLILLIQWNSGRFQTKKMKKIFYLIALFSLVSCNSQSKKIIPFETSEGWGFKQNEKITIEPQFGIVSEFTNCGIAAVGDSNGNYYINSKGEKLDIPTLEIDNFIDPFKEKYARFKKDNKLGFINECGAIVIDAIYENVTPFTNGIAIVRKDFKIIEKGPYKILQGGKYGAIDKKGTLTIPYSFDFISTFSTESTANAKINGKDVIIDFKGNIIK